MLLFNLIVIAILLFSLEAYLAYQNKQAYWFKNVKFNDRQVVLREYAPLIDTKVYPSDRFMEYVGAVSLKQENYTFRMDSNGCIMPSGIHAKPDYKIAFLGGSTTENFFVHEHNRFPYLSCHILEQRTGKKINCYNYGVSGMTSMHTNNILLNKVLPTKPDFAFWMHNINDLTTLTFTSSYWNESNRALTKRRKKITFARRLINLCKKIVPNTYVMIRDLLIDRTDDEWLAYRKKQYAFDGATILPNFESSLKTFIKICKSWDIRPVIMTQPNRFTDDLKGVNAALFDRANYSEFLALYEKMNNIIREVAGQNENVLFIDLERSIPKDTQYIYDMVHMSDDGWVLSSEIIADAMINLLNP